MIAVASQDNGTEFKSTAELLLEEVSASRLKRWSTCRLQFFFHYVQQIRKPATPALAVGRVVHSVLQEFNRARWKGQYGFKDILNKVFAEKWEQEQSELGTEWNGDEDKQKLATLGLLELYLEQSPMKPDEQVMGVEVSLSADLSKHGLPTLIGVIDLVRKGGVIVDMKTSAQSPNAEMVGHQNEIQLTCYGLLYRDATDQVESGFELHHLVKTKTPKLIVTALPPIKDNQETRLFKQIESYVQGVEREDYVPSPGMCCLSCQFQNECRHWHYPRTTSRRSWWTTNGCPRLQHPCKANWIACHRRSRAASANWLNATPHRYLSLPTKWQSLLHRWTNILKRWGRYGSEA